MTKQNRAAISLLRLCAVMLTGGLVYLITRQTQRSARRSALTTSAPAPVATPMPMPGQPTTPVVAAAPAAVPAAVAVSAVAPSQEPAPARVRIAARAARAAGELLGGFADDVAAELRRSREEDPGHDDSGHDDHPGVASATAVQDSGPAGTDLPEALVALEAGELVAEAERVLAADGARYAARLGRLLKARLLMLWLAFVAGGCVLAYAYVMADRGDTHSVFTVFWIGALLFMLPACTRIVQRHTPRAERLTLISALGAFEFLPKLMRNPTGPLFSDEFAHYRQTQALRSSGKLFADNPLITVIHHFPGLDIVVANLASTSGLSTWTSAELLLGAVHVLVLVGVFLIAERIGRSPMIGGIAAVIYAIAPNYMYFNAQYSYESLAIVQVIWAIVCIVIAHDDGRSAASRRGWLAIGGLIGLSSVPTHHLSSYFLAVLIGVMAAFGTFRRGGTPRRAITFELWALSATLLLAALAWAIFVAPDVTSYLDQPLEGAFQAVGGLFAKKSSSHKLFKGSEAPAWEQIFGFLGVPIAAATMGTGFRALWKRRDLRPLTLTFGLLAVGYFASLVLVATAAGSETGRRSWAFAFLGIGVIGAFGIATMLIGRHRRLAGAALVAAFVVATIGNVTVDLNVAYRFPGAYVYGSDTRSITPEVIAASKWFEQNEGAGQRVIADRYLSNALGGLDGAFTPNASPGFPIWQLYTTQAHPSKLLMYELAGSHWNYMVVDKRMAGHLPQVGVYFTSAEPVNLKVTAADIDALNTAPWLTKVWDSRNIEIFRFNFANYFNPPQVAPPAPAASPAPVRRHAPKGPASAWWTRQQETAR